MYVSVSHKALAFLHKHPDVHVVANLDFIAGVHADTSVITLTTMTGLDHLMETQLQQLWANTMGLDHRCNRSPYQGNALRSVLLELAARLPESMGDPLAIDREAARIENGEKGSFQALPLRATLTDAEAATAAAQRRPAPPVYQPVPKQPPVPADAVQRPVSAPRTGGTRQIINEVADRMWTEDGKPTTLPSILALRKRIMDVLERDHQIKRTTASTALGDWQKGRI